MLTAEKMRSLPDCFMSIPDPRRAQGRRHRLPVVLAIAAGAILCGMRGYSAIAQWANALGPQARARFGCRRVDGVYRVPSEFVIRDCLVRIEAGALDRALAAWNQAWGSADQAIAIDGKTMKNAIDEDGKQTHILSTVNLFSDQAQPGAEFLVMRSRSKTRRVRNDRSRINEAIV